MSRAHAVTYLRCASSHAQDRPALERQRPACLAAAERLDAIVDREFADRGASGNTPDRPGLRALLDYVANNDVSYVICADANRLARDLRLTDVLVETLARCGCHVVVADSGSTLPTSKETR